MTTKTTKLGRRDFLAGAGGLFLARFAVPQLLAWAVSGLASEAAAGSDEPWNYINLHCCGGPNRWGFDQRLRATASDALVPNPHVATAFAGGQPVYQTFEAQGVQLPQLFQFDVGKSDGGRRPMMDLLANMATIRGYTTGTDGHGVNQAKQTQPIPGGVSIGGLVADAFRRSISAIGVIPGNGSEVGLGYHSAKGLSQLRLQNLNALARELMTPFDSTSYTLSPDLASAKQVNAGSLDKAASALLAHAHRRDVQTEALKLNMEGAIGLIEKGVGDLDAYWAAALTRYQTAIVNSVRPQVLYPDGIPGITHDLAYGTPVVSDGTGRYGMPGTDSLEHTVDAGAPVAGLVQACTISYLAEYFALAEYAIVKGLSGSIELPIGFVDGLYTAATPSFGASGDEHGMGAGAGVVVDAMFFRGIAAALLELIDVLKQNGLFQRSLIHLTGDFSRSPHDGATLHGTDHGFAACATSLYSGVIQGPLLVGNIRADASDPANYPGTWGEAAPINELGAIGVAGPSHVAASIAALMGITKHPWSTSAPLLTLESDQAALAVEAPKTV